MKLLIEIDKEVVKDIYESTYPNDRLVGAAIYAIRHGKLLDSVLDEIKADIEKLDGMYVLRDHVFYAEKDPKHTGFWYIRLKDVIDILDKYKEESEEI